MILRLSRLLLAAGLLVVAMTAVAFAQDPTPTPTPEATVLATATPTAIATPVATPDPTLTPTPTATATPTPTPTATAEAPPTLLATAPQPSHRPRQTATPPPDPTPTPPDQFTGASLTICHLTAGGVYVPVVISADQYSAFFDEEADVIPAPPSGCDGITDPQVAADIRVTVCHLEADGKFSLHTYPPQDLGGHEGDKGDLIPAPNGTCPGMASAYGVPTATPTADTDADNGSGPEPTIPVDDAPTAATAPPTVASTVESGATAPATTQQLPFTGFDLWLIAVAGLAMTMMGAGLRLLAAQPPVGVTR